MLDLGMDVGRAFGLRETDAALHVAMYDEPKGAAWVPFSQLHEDSEVREPGDAGILIVTEWFAKKRGWGYYRTLIALEPTVVIEDES